MIRGKAAVMFDPTKLLPQNQGNVDRLIATKKSDNDIIADGENGKPSDPNLPSPSSDNDKNQATPSGGFNHLHRPKAAGKRRQVRIIQQDNTQRRQQAALELIQSEKMYHVMLSSFAKAFLPPIQEHPQQFGMTPTQASILSETFEKIIEFSDILGQDPELGTNPSAVFSRHLQRCKDLYSIYITQSIHHIFGLLNELTGSKQFRQHIYHIQADLQLNIIDSYLTPTSRLSIYELMLRKYAQTGDPNAVHLLQCADQLQQASSQHIQLLEDIEKSGKVLNIQLQLSMVGSTVVYLWNPERHLVQEAIALKSKISLQDGKQVDVNRAHGENKRRMLLFNDQLMWTTPLPNARYKGHVSVVNIQVEFDSQHDVPSLIVKPAHSTLPPDQKAPKDEKSDSSNEAWMIIFDETSQRDLWYQQVKSLQDQLQSLTTDSTLTIPIEIKEQQQGGCCTIM